MTSTSTTATKTISLLELCGPIQNEVCCCVAKKILAMIFQQGTMTVCKIYARINELFHGTKDVIRYGD
jgi:hypothetical protein